MTKRITATEIAHGRWQLDSPRQRTPCGCLYLVAADTRLLERRVLACVSHRRPWQPV